MTHHIFHSHNCQAHEQRLSVKCMKNAEGKRDKSAFWLVKITTGAQVLPPKKVLGDIFSTFVNFRVTCTDSYAIGVEK